MAEPAPPPKRVKLHPGQKAAMLSTARFTLVSAGTQAGKTFCGPYWMLQEIKRSGPGDYLVASPAYPLMSKKALPDFLRLFKRDLKLGNFVGGEHQKFVVSADGARRLFGDGEHDQTTVWFGHAANPDSLESGTYKAAWCDEAGQARFKYDSWLAILRRLSIHMGRVLISTTPYNCGWLKTEVHDRARNGDRDYEVIRFDSKDNPYFPIEEYERAQRTLPAWKFRMFYRGFFERPAGLIYDCFEPEQHVVPRQPIPPTWRRYIGIDFGGVNTVAVFFAEEPTTKILYLYREYWEGRRTAKEHAKAMMDGYTGTSPPIAVGGAKSEGQWRDEFRAGGLTIRPPTITEVEVGIDRLYAIIKSNRLRVFSDCVRTLDQLQTYSRKVNESGEVLEEIEDKAAQHLADACRYAATFLYRPSSGPGASGITVQPRNQTLVGSMPEGVFYS